MAGKMLANVKEHALQNGIYYANWDILMAWFALNPFEVGIVGENCHEKRKELDQYYLPNVFLYGGKFEGNSELLTDKLIEGKTTIYVCRNNACQRPVNEVKDALVQMK